MFLVFVKLHLWAQKMCHLNSGRSRPFHTAGLHLRRMLDCQLHMICLQAKQTHIGLDFTTKTAVLTHFQVILLYKTHTCIVQIIRYVQSVHHSQNRDAVAGVECIAEWKTFNKIKIQRKVCKQFINICEQNLQLTWWCRRSPVSYPVYIPASSSCSPKPECLASVYRDLKPRKTIDERRRLCEKYTLKIKVLHDAIEELW